MHIKRLLATLTLTAGTLLFAATPAMACSDGKPAPGCPTTTTAPTTSTTVCTPAGAASNLCAVTTTIQTYPAPSCTVNCGETSSTSTIAPTTTTTVPDKNLPITGGDVEGIVLIGLAAFAAGAIIIRANRKKPVKDQ